MSRSHRLLMPLLVGGLLLPAATVAQDDLIRGWSEADDNLVFATNDDLDAPPGWSAVPKGSFPAILSAIPGPDQLYRIDGTLESGTRIANLHDGGSLPWLEEGRTPVLAKAVVDDDGATWTRLQHVISTPAGCSEGAREVDACVQPELLSGLADMAAPQGSPVAPAPFADHFEPGFFASTGVADHDGTLFSFAGGASVGTSVKVRNDDSIVVRGDADIGDGLGGRLRGFDVTVVPIPRNGSDFITPPGWGPLDARARDVRDVWVQNGKPLRSVEACPPSRRGYVVSQFLIGGVGRNAGPAVASGLEGGAPVFISEVIPFDCGASPVGDSLAAGPGDGPAAALVCGWTRSVHRPFVWTRDGRKVTSNSSLLQRYLVATLGISPDTAATLISRMGGTNHGDVFSVGLEGVQLDSALEPEVMLWFGETQVGIESYGDKPFHDLQLSADGLTFDLIDQQHDLLGEAFDVGPSQKPVTNCPGLDLSLENLGEVFSDGFESGDISAWSDPKAD